MTPDERTAVLAAILKYDTGSIPVIICPTSWLKTRIALGASNQSVGTNWAKLTNEQRLAIWLEAPDSDYEFARDHTFIFGEKGHTL